MIGLGEIGGFIGLTALCWALKLPPQIIYKCLLLGLSSLIFTVLMGAISEHELLQLSLNWLDLYLFVGPVVFGLIHVVLLFRQGAVNPG